MRRPRSFEATLDKDFLQDHPKTDISAVPIRHATKRHHGVHVQLHSGLVSGLILSIHPKARLEQLLPAAEDAPKGSARQQHSDDGHRRKVPMDPVFSLGIITLSFAGLGWLAGPSLGSAIFYTIKRGVKRPMGLKESEFFNRIKKNRVDPSNSSLSGNAVPDFYGEKISSVAGYRQWLKDQRAFNKKRTSFV
ncbi:hypothetical protein E0Z10_g2468 [Xylaria hypoxylon]|uniref:Presequence translocated-associated motor subunit PAM17 n=1 Tax=Xylaria hypoxylon TaxID=37992 RepID=A0A4Z0Z3R4_9PEZI|nr:hypothetical protein E0Z10_g2468 [Xylaria hypoxylon]